KNVASFRKTVCTPSVWHRNRGYESSHKPDKKRAGCRPSGQREPLGVSTRGDYSGPGCFQSRQKLSCLLDRRPDSVSGLSFANPRNGLPNSWHPLDQERETVSSYVSFFRVCERVGFCGL